jgi:hypothetical protein
VIFHSYLSLPEGTSYQSSQQKLREEFMLQASKIWCQSRFPIFFIFQPFKLGQTQKLQKKKQLHNFQQLSNPPKKTHPVSCSGFTTTTLNSVYFQQQL